MSLCGDGLIQQGSVCLASGDVPDAGDAAGDPSLEVLRYNEGYLTRGGKEIGSDTGFCDEVLRWKEGGCSHQNADAENASAQQAEARAGEAIENRTRFTKSLQSLGYSPTPSSANFVLVPVSDCAEAAGRLRTQGVAVRAFAALTGIGDALRISIGPWEMMQRCLDALAVRE